MPHAQVAQLADGEVVSHVELDEAHPFAVVDGPSADEIGLPLAWARSVAERVTLRVREGEFSAGIEPIDDLPAWEGTPPAPHSPATGSVRYEVRATTAWTAPDVTDVAGALFAALETMSVRVEERPGGFTLVLAVEGADETDAGLRAARLLGTAWARAGLTHRADDYDLSHLDVHPS